MQSISNESQENNLIIALKRGDATAMATALAQVYKLHFGSILAFIIANGGSNDEAKDVYQEAVIVLYENIQKPDFVLSCKIKTYLYSVSRHLWLKELEKKKQFVGSQTYDTLQDTEVFMMMQNGETIEYEQKEAQYKAMYQSLDLLGEPCKTLMTDFYIQHLSMQEIADKMGYTNAANAKTQKYKCLQRLTKIFDKNYIHRP